VLVQEEPTGSAARSVGGAESLRDEQLRAVLAEHAPVLRAVALRLSSGDPGRAEDVVQETLIRAWQHPEVLDATRGSTRGWLLTTLRNIAIDGFRAERARPVSFVESPPEGPDPLSGAREVDQLLEQAVVVDALGAIAPLHRQAIVECYYVGRTVTDAAEVLGVPPGTIKSRLFYGMRALREALAERGVLSVGDLT
jgi:RNA polymerase sigma-70 factor (ECF subfamily)